MKARIILSAVLLSAFLFACNKEVIVEPNINGPVSSGGNNGNNNGNGNTGNNGNNGGSTSTDITGTWKLASIESKNFTQTSYDFGGTTVSSTTVMNFLDNVNAAGLFTFAANHATAKGMTFKVKTTLSTTMVTSGVSQPMTQDLEYTIPATDSESSYQLIGKDSIQVPLMAPDLSGLGLSADISFPEVTTYGYLISGDTLTMEGRLIQKDVTTDIQGLQGKVNSDAYQKLKFVRVK
ncbi:hypothetical protein ACE38W_18345 [Chitinophaga sp. Hz27]|uniref:hypothetical protein n=1 Tax=Chitinophaga sp. Hz27 TaxID=3347169 RepID=UPI0035DB483A